MLSFSRSRRHDSEINYIKDNKSKNTNSRKRQENVVVAKQNKSEVRLLANGGRCYRRTPDKAMTVTHTEQASSGKQHIIEQRQWLGSERNDSE